MSRAEFSLHGSGNANPHKAKASSEERWEKIFNICNLSSQTKFVKTSFKSASLFLHSRFINSANPTRTGLLEPSSWLNEEPAHLTSSLGWRTGPLKYLQIAPQEILCPNARQSTLLKDWQAAKGSRPSPPWSEGQCCLQTCKWTGAQMCCISAQPQIPKFTFLVKGIEQGSIFKIDIVSQNNTLSYKETSNK